MFFAAVLGSLLDLYFVKNGLYEFPLRLFPHLFSINIIFTLCALPLLTLFHLIIMKKINTLERWLVILIISFLAPLGEMISERCSLFIHSERWNHSYSFIGYFIYLIIAWNLFQWLSEKSLHIK